MAAITTAKLQGFLIPEANMTPANIVEADSSYSEAGPRPGTVFTTDTRDQFLPVISGNQEHSVEFSVSKSGQPGNDLVRACRVVYEVDADGVTIGKSDDSAITRWTPCHWSLAVTIDAYVVASLSLSQDVLYCGHDSAAVAGVQTAVRRWNTTTNAWATAYVFDSDILPTGMVQLPSGRVIITSAGVISYYSDDEGVTWALYADHSGDGAPTPGVANGTSSMVYSDTGLLMIYVDSTGDLVQMASSDYGVTWYQVGAGWAVSTRRFGLGLSSLPNGSIVLAYLDASDYAQVRVVGSAFSAFSDATDYAMYDLGALRGVTTWVVGSRIYAITTQGGGSDTRYSDDLGATWTYLSSMLYTGDGTSYLDALNVIRAKGESLLFHQSIASSGVTTYDQSVGCLHLASWAGGCEFNPMYGSHTGILSLPFELGNTTAWTAATTAGTYALSSSGAHVFTNATGYYFLSHFTAAADLAPRIFGEVRVISGGSITSSICGCSMYMGDGSNFWRIDLRVATTGFRLVNYKTGTTLVDVTRDMSTDYMQFSYWCSSYAGGAADRVFRLAYRASGDRDWTVATTAAVPVSAAATGNYIRWGNLGAGASEVAFRYFGFRRDITLSDATNPRVTADFVGGQVSTSPEAIPYIGSDTSSAFLSAVSGPAVVGKIITIDPAHDYPVENIFHQVSPSPRAKWRSTDTTEQTIVVDVSPEHLTGDGSLGVAVLGANFRYMYIYGYNADWGWLNLGTIDLAFVTSLDFVSIFQSASIIPGGAVGHRQLRAGELEGGTFTDGTRYNRITGNTSGGLVNTAKFSTIQLDGTFGVDSGTTGEIWHSNGVWLDTRTYSYGFGKIKIVIPAQTTADGYFELGGLHFGKITTLGRQWSRGYQWATEANSETTRDRFGTSRTRKNGKAPRSLTVGWSDGLDVSALHGLTASPDYLTNSGGYALANYNDVSSVLEGIIQETGSGETPVIILPQLPPSNTAVTVTDPTLFLYGRIAGGVQEDNVLGFEGESEVVRLSTITVEEVI